MPAGRLAAPTTPAGPWRPLQPSAVTVEVHNSIDGDPLTRAQDPTWSA
ncbi:MAG TPA: hypothetical protein VFX16_13810 [Pseudonocardiaceae bacterium]|nr:hypothetical protein [Pseudonocardiaceae bacterium]